MTFGHVSPPVRSATRRRLAVLIPLVVGIVVGAVLWSAGEHTHTQLPPPAVVEHVCTFTPPPAPPPKPVPPSDVWGGLDRCLREHPWDTSVATVAVTVADVWRWVEVEGDPVWFSEGMWWFPLSGEGNRQVPSGLYVGVPLQASAPCGGAIIN